MYGYTPAVALALPIVQFFTLHREGRKIENELHVRQMIDLCSVASITFGGHKQLEAVQDYFKSRGNFKPDINEEIARGYDLTSADSTNALRGFFGGLNG
jgi:hypothetical protein